MNKQDLHLAPFYKGWEEYQQHLVNVLAPLSSEQLTLHAESHLRSLGDLATHIIGARARWLYYVLQEGHDILLPMATWDRAGQPIRSAAELVSGLETTWQV